MLGAVSVATACMIEGSVAAEVAQAPRGEATLQVEHPTGFFTVAMDVSGHGAALAVQRAALLRTARRLMVGTVFVPAETWAA